MSETFVNDRTPVHKGYALPFVAMAPDVCKTPTPGGPVPMPYPNVARAADLADGAATVRVQGEAAAHADAQIRTSTGDEAGSAGGVISNKVKGNVRWVLYSTDVKFEGRGAVRFLDDTLHNGNTPNSSGKTGGKNALYPGHDERILCDNCGQPITGHPQLPSSPRAREEAKKAHGRTTAALVIDCGGEPKVYKAEAGSKQAAEIASDFPRLAKNFRHGTPIPAKAPTDNRVTAGNCAEQQVLLRAFHEGRFPPRKGCTASLAVMRLEDGAEEKTHVESCDTCMRVLSSLLCENDPKQPPPSPP